MASQKKLGFIALTSLVFGNMVGSGMFMLPSSLASYGSIGLVAWVVTAIGAIFLALVFSRLAKVCPKSGGPYAYCREAFGDFTGFQIAYCYWIATWVGNAAIVVALMGPLAYFFPILKVQPYAIMCSLGVLWLATWINISGVKQAGFVQVVTAVMKFIPILGMAFLGFFYMDVGGLSAYNISGESNLSAFAATASMTVWSFIGIESATVPAGEAENPKVNIPRATVLGTLLATLVYVASTAVIMGLVPMQELAQSDAPFVLAAEKLFGHWGGDFVAIVSIVAILGTLNGWILMQAQMPMAAAEDGLFPKLFCKLGKKGTPVFGLTISSLLISVLLLMHSDQGLVRQFVLITELAVVATLIPYLYSAVCEIVLMITRPELLEGRRERRSAWLMGLLAFVFVFLAFFGVDAEIFLPVLLLLLSSAMAYVAIIK